MRPGGSDHRDSNAAPLRRALVRAAESLQRGTPWLFRRPVVAAAIAGILGPPAVAVLLDRADSGGRYLFTLTVALALVSFVAVVFAIERAAARRRGRRTLERLRRNAATPTPTAPPPTAAHPGASPTGDPPKAPR